MQNFKSDFAQLKTLKSHFQLRMVQKFSYTFAYTSNCSFGGKKERCVEVKWREVERG